uniref:Capsid protein n=1 Tax=Parvoviridae sp. TaxID=1940570 RepID=A0A7D3UKS6_9VIRU|nr:MAG: capsid protein [Parvoviridae sp.]
MNHLFQIPKMTDKHVITNVYCAYFDNDLHRYPSDDVPVLYLSDEKGRYQYTGWHVAPNVTWDHFVTPKQWAEMCINYEAYHVEGMKLTIFNPVPITTNIAIQRTNLFAAFNNCTYLWGYEDDLYETSNFPWCNLNKADRLNLAFKEGAYVWGNMGSIGNASADTAVDASNYRIKRYKWPIYRWRVPDHRTPHENVWGQGMEGNGVFFAYKTGVSSGKLPSPSGIYWDPLNRPDHIKELRAGKNAMSFNWECAPCDSGKFFNLDQLASWIPWTPAGPYCGARRPGTHTFAYGEDPDQLTTFGLAQSAQSESASGTTGVIPWQDYTIPNFAYIPVVPNSWFWKEMHNSIVESDTGVYPKDKPDLYCNGTEYENYKYPPAQWFCKGIPLLDGSDQLIKTTTQASVKVELILQCKKRRSALFCPTWGPFAGKQLYHHDSSSRIYQPNMLRYRTAGARRSWQNWNRWYRTGQDNTQQQQVQAHPREDPYIIPYHTYASDAPIAPLYTTNSVSVTSGGFKVAQAGTTTVTYTKATDEVVMSWKPQAPRRKQRDKSPARLIDEQMMEDLQQGP